MTEILSPVLKIEAGLGDRGFDPIKTFKDGNLQPPGQSPTEDQSLVETPFSFSSKVWWNGYDPVRFQIQPAVFIAVLKKFRQRMAQSLMMPEFKLNDQGTELTPVVSVGTGEVKGVFLDSALGAGSLELQYISRQWNPAGVAKTSPQRLQAEKATLTQWAPIRIEHPLMAKDTGLREEKCLGELLEGFSASHTDYNGSGQEIYETTADRWPRSAETQNPKSQIPNRFQK